MSLDPDKGSRTCGTKVRTGCLTCKTRRLKCDETFQNGSCLRCRKSKRQCQASSSQGAEFKIIHYVSKAPQYPVPWPELNEKEHKYYHRFYTCTALDLAGSFSPEFWTTYTTTIALSEPAIKHAVVALAALHEQYQARKGFSFGDPGMQYPLSQCIKAISLLTKAMDTSDEWSFPDTALVACMLFCAFDSMSYHLDSAISHLKGGIKLLLEHLQRPNSVSSAYKVSPSVLHPLFVRLDTQGLQLTEHLSTPDSFPFPYQLQTTGFKNVAEAHTAYSEAFNMILRTIYDADSSNVVHDFDSCKAGPRETTRYEQNAANIGRVYSTWCTSFDELISRGVAVADLQSCILMQIWRLATNLNVQIDLKKGDMDYDRFYPHFEAIVKLVYESLIGSTQNHESTKVQPLASLPANLLAGGHGGFFYHHGPNSGNLRSGNLHLHPHLTPFISNPALDANLHNTTSILLEQARASRPPYCAHLDTSGEIHLPEMRPSFSFSTGFIVPLYVTISRCRDPRLRRRALMLMQHCKRREGLWDSDLAARLGERVLQIEEHEALRLRVAAGMQGVDFEECGSSFDGHGQWQIKHASQIPNEARVRLIRPTFLPNRRSVERYFMGWSGSWEDAAEQHERWIQEEMEW